MLEQVNTRTSCMGGMEYKPQPGQDYILQTIRHGFNIYAKSCVAFTAMPQK